jgi:hypothetical protein
MSRTCLNCYISIDNKHKLAKFCSIQCKNASWQIANYDKMLIAAAKYRNSEKGQYNIKANAAKVNEQVKAWKLANRERQRELDKNYHLKNQGNLEYLAKRRYHEANRRARRLQATPKWLSLEQKQQIKQFYINCPIGHHVDHIVPLKGKNVSGLHAPWNLQWLPGIVNKIKSNKVT